MKQQLEFGLGAIACVALLAGCNTTPERPYTPAPQVQPSPPPPPPPTQPSTEQNAATSTAGQEPSASQPPPQASAEAPSSPPPTNTPPPSNDSADVQITDIPVDEDGNPIKQDPPTATTSGGGGSPTPPSGEQRAEAGASSGGAPGSQPPRAPGADAGPDINIGARTGGEQVAALEQDLNGRLAKFDELMRRAREEAEQERAQAGGGANSGGGGYGGAAAGSPTGGEYEGQGARREPPPMPGSGGQADTSSGLGHTPDVTGSTSGAGHRQAAGPIPTDIPDARDDDIVARQLREAATRESDPVLREKLWEEYRKYKQGLSR